MNPGLDTSLIDFINLSSETLFLYRQYTNCFKCPLIQLTSIQPGQNKTIQLRSFYEQAYVVTKNNETFWNPISVKNSCNICNISCEKSKLTLRDKSHYQLLVDVEKKCYLTMLEAGQNQWISASIVLIVYVLLILAILYGYKMVQKYWKNSSSSNRNTDSPLFPNNSSAIRSSHRFHSIDSLRGMSIMLMIFVNYGAGRYKSLEHAPWDGINLADVVFPFFIFVMGMSIALSFKNVVSINDNFYKTIRRIIKRSINLFLLGIIVNSIGAADIKTIRIPGVLQRFALSYGIVATVQLVTSNLITSSYMPRCLNCIKLWPQYALALVMISIYSYFTFFWNFDENCPIGYLGPGGLSENISFPHCVGGAAHKIDQLIFTINHCYRNFFGGILYDQGFFNLWHDPEGLLGVTTSVVLTVIGLQAGHTVIHNVQPWARFRRLINMIVMLAIITFISIFYLKIPVNKNLWSLSFVTLNGCFATIVFALCHYLIDLKKLWPNGFPFNYPGQNSIMLYLGHEIANDMLPFKLADSYSNHWGYLAQNLFATTVWMGIAYWMATNEIFITV